MGKADLHWSEADVFELVAFVEEVSEADGVVSFMYGGFGHYYKISWALKEQKGFGSGEKADTALQRARSSFMGRR